MKIDRIMFVCDKRTSDFQTDNIVDVFFTVTPTNTGWLQTPYGNYLLVFGANYTAPLATAQPPGVYFAGVNGWQWFVYSAIKNLAGSGSGCALRASGTPTLIYNPATTGAWNYCTYDDPQYAQPSTVQQFPGGMELQWIFDRSDSPTDRIFLSGMKWFASQNRLPADFVYVVNHPVSGHANGFRARMIYEPSFGIADAGRWQQNVLDAQAAWAGISWP